MILNGLLIILAYLIGSLSGSLLIGHLRGVDIRTLGSGNAGGTNAFRTQGIGFALPVVLIDISKGVVASLLPILITGSEATATIVLLCALASVFGHCYPIWHGFRGGKGAGTALGAMLPCVLIWIISLILSGWVGLATINAFIGLFLLFAYQQAGSNLVLFSCLLALLILFMHRSNVQRILKGQENRFEKVYWRNWFRA